MVTHEKGWDHLRFNYRMMVANSLFKIHFSPKIQSLGHELSKLEEKAGKSWMTKKVIARKKKDYDELRAAHNGIRVGRFDVTLNVVAIEIFILKSFGSESFEIKKA